MNPQQQQQQPPYGQWQGGAPYYQGGPPPQGQMPPQGQAPYQQQQQQQPPYTGYGSPPPPQQQPYQGPSPPGQPNSAPPPPPQGQYPPQGSYAPQGQYQPQGQYPPPQGQYPPPGPAGQYPAQQGGGGPGQYPPPGQYHPPQQQPQAQGQQVGYGQPPPQQPQGQYQNPQQWQGQQPGYANFAPTPASPGYDQAQQAWAQPVDTTHETEAIRKAMKGMGCDEKALIKAFTSPKFSSPWAMAQLVRDYNGRFVRDLAKDIESETRGELEDGLLALIRGPLEQDVYALTKALKGVGTDEDALMDALLCRSNADLRAITAAYKARNQRELLVDIKDDVNDDLFRMYSMILSATRAEDSAPVHPHETDQKATDLQRATEGVSFGANAPAVFQVFCSSSPAQLHAVADAYQRKYHRSLAEVVEKEFRGDTEDALLRMLEAAQDRARVDARLLRDPLFKDVRGGKKRFVNRVVALYWDRPRLEAAKQAYRQKFLGAELVKDVKAQLGGDIEDLLVALIGK